MSDWREAGYIMRIATVIFVLPVMVIATGFFFIEGMYVYAAAMLLFESLLIYGVYMNWKRLAGDGKIDDERMRMVNRKSGSNAFWTMMNAAVFFGIFGSFIAQYLPFSYSTLSSYDVSALLGIGFISYFSFRFYYLKYGVENEFWRLDG